MENNAGVRDSTDALRTEGDKARRQREKLRVSKPISRGAGTMAERARILLAEFTPGVPQPVAVCHVELPTDKHADIVLSGGNLTMTRSDRRRGQLALRTRNGSDALWAVVLGDDVHYASTAAFSDTGLAAPRQR